MIPKWPNNFYHGSSVTKLTFDLFVKTVFLRNGELGQSNINCLGTYSISELD